ncbi:MAG: FhaA domain-containing protein [Mycobacterium sp.]
MGLVQRLDRKLESTVGDAFARVFGGSIVPKEVEGMLRREAADGVRSLQGGRLLAPNEYVITLSVPDHDKVLADPDLTADTFAKHLGGYISEQGWQTYGEVVVRFAQSPNLHTGQVRARGIVNPDANRDAPAGVAPRASIAESAPPQSDQASTAEPGVPPMSDNPSQRGSQGQGQPGDEYYDDRYGRPQEGRPQDDPRAADPRAQDQGGYPPPPPNYPPPRPAYPDQGGYPQDQGGYAPSYDQRPPAGYGPPSGGYDPNAGRGPAAPGGYPQGGNPYGAPGQPGPDYGRPPVPPNRGYDDYGRPGYPDQGGYDQGYQGGQAYGRPEGRPGDYGQGQPEYGGRYADAPSGGYGEAPRGDYDYGQQPDYGQPDYGQQPAPGGYAGYGQAAPPAYPGGANVTLQLDDGSGRTYQLREGANVVGRGQDAQFRLPDTGVSRRHLEIRWDGQVALLSDLNSTNGTTVNNAPIQEWQLADGDVIRLGHSEIVVRVH